MDAMVLTGAGLAAVLVLLLVTNCFEESRRRKRRHRARELRRAAMDNVVAIDGRRR